MTPKYKIGDILFIIDGSEIEVFGPVRSIKINADQITYETGETGAYNRTNDEKEENKLFVTLEEAEKAAKLSIKQDYDQSLKSLANNIAELKNKATKTLEK